ncbi:dipeptidyl aminopeptidase/acylaminoacyl peptidase [Streptosporangium becharense]|uniref:Dipeptidyl aminopeptidase/acylaminoacyl peptidase n=1 Tax=Streptosporangium becharense TaxID=1816182 RepID=A0A7W9IG63_9ACTN|nr:prolyl oligopeptidase family serine peptidase [Streptosporangium becharense]MBB2908929.1 dipeptidyl aminopeptidase/acylaminoacyl peptidase [Streptosporangium becharense]MBB5820053.1 dipeptidyl aminopeptidase/acylaminoacyl peptidase [Streptosporangium becharense]
MKAEERWQARFRAPRVTLPAWARQAPGRALYRGNASGTWEIYAWDRRSGSVRQATARPKGTSHAEIDPTGRWIWWFCDTDGDEWGRWMRQPFDGGPDEPVDLEPGFPAGIALASTGEAVIGMARPGRGFTIHLLRPGEPPSTLYEHTEAASVSAVSLDGSLIAIGHSEHGDSRHPALRVLRRDGDVVGDLHDGPGKGVVGLRFAPVQGDRRLLALHERRGRREPLVWDPESGEQREIWLRDPGEITAEWYDDGRSLLVVRDHRGRTTLTRYDLAGGALHPIETRHGVIHAAVPRPDGSVEYSWSSGAHPPVIRSSGGHVVLNHSGPTPPPSVPVEDVDVEGPGGRVHALVSRPERGSGPFPAVFLLHGGPTAQDDDSFVPQVAAWVDLGFAVVRVNYRGSTGYGSAWRDALSGDVGHIELSDVAAVRDAMVERGVCDPDRLVLAGASWGGYLTLLGLGTQPKMWAAGIAGVPIADHRAAYEEETEALRSYHRALLGGSPEEQPERYAASSPITYVDQVEAPVLILAGENDPRCPIGQIEAYVTRLAGRGHEHEVYRYDAGHGSLVVAERIAQMAAQLDFARKHVKTDAQSP